MNQKLKEAFDANLRAFIKNEMPICFGRIEGMKEYAECIDDADFIIYVKEQIAKNRIALEKACGD